MVDQGKKFEVPLNSIANIFRTKVELYTLLQNHGGYYLPSLEKTPCQFLRDFLVGKKLLLKLKDVKTKGKIPRFELLRVKKICEKNLEIGERQA